MVKVSRSGLKGAADSAASCARVGLVRAQRCALRFQPLDEPPRHRTSDQATHDQAERGCR